MADLSKQFKKGDPLKAEDLQAIVDEVKALGGFHSGSGTISTRRGARGIQIAHSPEAVNHIGQSNGISAMSGTLFGTGTVDVYWADNTGNAAAIGETLDVMNFSHTSIPSGKNCAITKDVFGQWWVTSVEC